VVSNEVVSN